MKYEVSLCSVPVKSDLTNPHYWSERQKQLPLMEISRAYIPEWLYVIEPFLREYEGKTFMELGCSPGHASALICSRIRFIPYGIDFSPRAHLYKENLAKIGQNDATLIISDIRDFKSNDNFDVVCSFGLIEHFRDPTEMMFHHDRLVRTGGLIIMVIPNFRYIQWLYHFLFDRKDLSIHNTRMMNLNTFTDFSEKMNHEILYLDYVGRFRLWNVDITGTKVIVYGRRMLSRIVREFSNRILSKVFAANSKYYAPWIVYIGKKSN
ncbi:MAG: methyltransferase domain-containing protein [Nitrospirota bacterium]